MKLEYPLHDAMPDIEHTRDRLLAKIFRFRADATGPDAPSDQDYELLYSYSKHDQHLRHACLDLILTALGSSRDGASRAGHRRSW